MNFKPGNFLMSFLMGVVTLLPSRVQLRNALFHCSQSKMAKAASLKRSKHKMVKVIYKLYHNKYTKQTYTRCPEKSNPFN